jgi:acetoin utilization deacetylase AcuC-like enzyme
MLTFYSDHFVLPLPEGHRFPMEKYRLLRERVEAELPACELRVPDAATDVELLRVHDPAYLAALGAGLDSAAARRIGFPWSPGLVERSRRSVGGTIGAARAALAEGVGANLAGGTHHAFAGAGEGFCVFNDVAVAIETLRPEGRVSRVAVVDLDVHQGNGTASIFRGDEAVLTVSVHGGNNYPFRKETSDVDLPLPDGADDGAYLAAVDRALEAAGAHRPDLVFYVGGADPYADDRLGRLAVTAAGLAERDRRVLGTFEHADVPVAVVMGGGYARDVNDTVAIHLATVRVAAEVAERRRAGGPQASARSTSR